MRIVVTPRVLLARSGTGRGLLLDIARAEYGEVQITLGSPDRLAARAIIRLAIPGHAATLSALERAAGTLAVRRIVARHAVLAVARAVGVDVTAQTFDAAASGDAVSRHALGITRASLAAAPQHRCDCVRGRAYRAAGLQLGGLEQTAIVGGAAR
jgi:hypothetical protein